MIINNLLNLLPKKLLKLINNLLNLLQINKV